MKHSEYLSDTASMEMQTQMYTNTVNTFLYLCKTSAPEGEKEKKELEERCSEKVVGQTQVSSSLKRLWHHTVDCLFQLYPH